MIRHSLSFQALSLQQSAYHKNLKLGKKLNKYMGFRFFPFYLTIIFAILSLPSLFSLIH